LKIEDYDVRRLLPGMYWLVCQGFRGGGIQDLMIAEEFWLAMARNVRTSAKQIVAWLEVPPVVVLAYLFELIESKEGKAADFEACR
jgi:hypothetical protein